MRILSILTLGALAALSLNGCAKAAKDTSGFALENTFEVDMPFDQTWQVVKDVLLDEELYLYTRDKRGTFVAFSEPTRRPFKTRRVQYTVELERISDSETSIYIETIRQKYGVTMMTYPDWHDRQTTDTTKTEQLIASINAWVANDGQKPGGGDGEAEVDTPLTEGPMPAGPEEPGSAPLEVNEV